MKLVQKGLTRQILFFPKWFCAPLPSQSPHPTAFPFLAPIHPGICCPPSSLPDSIVHGFRRFTRIASFCVSLVRALLAIRFISLDPFLTSNGRRDVFQNIAYLTEKRSNWIELNGRIAEKFWSTRHRRCRANASNCVKSYMGTGLRGTELHSNSK